MKRFFVLLMVFTTAAGAFAQFSWNLSTDFNTGLLSWNIPAGERAEKFITINNGTVPNDADAAHNPAANRGVYTYTSGGFDSFSYGKGDWLRSNELRLTIDYVGQAVEFHTRTLLDPLVRFDLISSAGGQNNTTGDHSFVQGSGRTPNWNDFLRYSFDEWYIKGTALFLTGYVGNTPDRGKVDGYNTFTEDVLRTVFVEHYGVNTPTADADFDGNGQDLNNFRTRPVTAPGSSNTVNFDWVMPYFMAGARLGMTVGKLKFPVTFQIAADPGNNTGVSGTLDYYRINGSFRLSAEKIANAVTFDAIYRFRGGDPSTLDSYDPDYNPGGVLHANGQGHMAHAFGLYANVLAVPKLGIGLGYSGYLVAYEDDENTNKTGTGETISKSGPLYSGIDLRLQYTGLKNITITSINNVSFALARPSAGNKTSVGILGLGMDRFSAQSWFALYNALGLDWKLSERLSASFQIANRYGIIAVKESLSTGVSMIERSRVTLGGGGYAAFQFNRFLLMQGGIAFRYQNDSYSNTASGSQNDPATRNASGGTFDIAIPIRLNVVFGK